MSRHALGVLFVHGIGEQPRGDTLLTFSEPLIRCVRGWMEGRDIGSADVVESKLSASQLGSEEPAHAVLEIAVRDRSPEKWLLAESWWADEFSRPPFMKLAAWLLTIGPWAIISHASRWLGDAPRGQVPYQLLKVVLAVPLSMLMQIVVALLAVVAWLPIPVVRRAVSGFLLRVTGTLGDSYVLLEDPVQKAAAIGAVRHNVRWLADRCDDVAVVAHSQGAAIARLALAERRHPKVCVLVTFGSGVAKLTELGSMSTETRARSVRTILWVSLVAIALLPRALSLTTDDDARSILWTLYLFLPLAMMVAALTVVWGNIKAWPERAAELSLSPLDWIDYWATADPVPNGPLAPADKVRGLRQFKITNRINWLTDHSTYWENWDEFVMPVARELDQRAGSGVFTVETPAKIPGIPGRRVRVALLALARAAIVFLATPIMLYAFRGQLEVFGRDVILQSLSERPLTKPVAELLTGLGSFVGLAIGPLVELDAVTLDRWGHASVAALLLVAMMAAWYRFCVLPLWENWNGQCFEWLCRPARIPAHFADRALRPFLLSVVAAVPVLLAARALFQPNARLLLEEVLNVVVASPVVVMAFFMVVFVGALVFQVLAVAVRGVRRLVGR
ncbi:MAG TPA: hypothetical protein VFO58_01460 [Vicinamibacterales bacterium]|nr:hypothetical protein [Vicinamibacterales bacterium]